MSRLNPTTEDIPMPPSSSSGEEKAMDPTILVPLTYSKRHGVLVETVNADQNTIRVICRDDVELMPLLELQRQWERPLELDVHPQDEFNAALKHAFEQDSTATMQDAGRIDSQLDINQLAKELSEPTDLLESADDAPIIRLINAVLTEAVKHNASDIHIEPYEEVLLVRLRVDGILREMISPKKVLAPLIVSRIKVMAKLDIAEKRLPQDGRISLRIAGRPVDVRVSIIPTGHGERVVLRLLDKQAGRLDLEQLGMPPPMVQTMSELIQRPNGIILVTGPTGSGKTTTLYAVLKRLNQTVRNIMTVEDPIEYDLSGVSQTQVNAKVELTFARGLRAILRQDPDVVMVGEIRDLETAQIAVQSSLTGHLVLSTLHTNSAIGAVTRLRDMGVEPFLLSSSLIGLLAQRLVRLLCPDCRIPAQLSAIDLRDAGLPPEAAGRVMTSEGCLQCGYSGYQGRSGIYELIPVDGQMRTLIHEKVSEHELEKYARVLSASLFQDGVRLVMAGLTSLEEVARVTRED